MKKYEELADTLRRRIIEGDLAPGSRLPAENDLAGQEGISRQTVRQALSLLEREGLISKRRGSSTTVADPAGRRLAGRIAVVTTYIGEYIFPDILRGIERTLAEGGFAPTLLATHNRVESERTILSELLQGRIDGIIIEGTKTALPNPNIDLFQRLRSKGIPMVFINGYYPDFKPSVYVVADDRQGGNLATEYLLRKGHTRIAGVFKSDDIQGHRRYAGYAGALRRAGQAVADDRVLWYMTETCDTLIENSLIKAVENCTALLCYNDEVAVKALRRLQVNGIAVPGEIAVIGFDDSIFGSLASPRITSLSLSKEEIGCRAATSLTDLIAGRQTGPQILSWRLIEKEST